MSVDGVKLVIIEADGEDEVIMILLAVIALLLLESYENELFDVPIE